MPKAYSWGDLSSQDLIQLLDLVSEERLNEVFYPVPETKPGMGLFGGWKNHSSHPLHPDYIQPVAWVDERSGLLSFMVIDQAAERERQAERDRQTERERQAERELQAARVGKHWQAIKSKRAFQLLEADANFKKARAVFRRKQSAKEGDDLYANPFAEFRFIDSVSATAGWFLLTDGTAFNWPVPDKKAIGNPNKRGVEKLRMSIDDINDDIAARIAGSNATVSRQKALDYLSGVRAKAGNQVSPTADVGAIQGVADDFLSHPNITSDAIPVQQAQELKKGTYQALRGQYGQVRGSAIEAQKAVARGLKDQIAEVVPGIGPLNAEEARLLKTLDVAERRALMEMNKNPMGLSILAGNKAAFVGFMADRSAAFKALAARAINRAAVAPTYATTLGDQLANPMLRGGLLAIGAHPHQGDIQTDAAPMGLLGQGSE